MKQLPNILLFLLVLSLLLVSPVVLAQGGGGGGGASPGFKNPLGDDVDIADIILRAVKFLLSLAAVLALAAVVVGGLFYIISFGNEDRAKLGKKAITYAIIGLLLIGASFLIVQTVDYLINVY